MVWDSLVSIQSEMLHGSGLFYFAQLYQGRTLYEIFRRVCVYGLCMTTLSSEQDLIRMTQRVLHHNGLEGL